MSLVHITHYNDEADAADRTINLTGNGGTPTTSRWSTDRRPPRRRARSPPRRAAAAGTRRSRPRVRPRNPLGVNRVARHRPRRPRGRRRADPRPQRFGQVDAGVDHGRADWRRPPAPACSTASPSSDQVGAVAISFQAARLQLMRGRVDLEIASAAGFDYHDHRPGRGRAGRRRPGPRAGLRRIDQLSGGQMRRVVLAGLLARSAAGARSSTSRWPGWTPPASAGCCGCWRTCAATPG